MSAEIDWASDGGKHVPQSLTAQTLVDETEVAVRDGGLDEETAKYLPKPVHDIVVLHARRRAREKVATAVFCSTALISAAVTLNYAFDGTLDFIRYFH